MKKKLLAITAVVALSGLFYSVYADALNKAIAHVVLNLTDKGLPLTITVPDGIEAKGTSKTYYGTTEKTVTLKKDKFQMEISTTSDNDNNEDPLEDIVAQNQRLHSAGSNFVKIEESFPGGYIFKTNYSNKDDYDFFYALIKDGKVYTFHTGNAMISYTLDEVKTMAASARSAK